MAAEVLEGRPVALVGIDLDRSGRKDVVADHSVAVGIFQQVLPQAA